MFNFFGLRRSRYNSRNLIYNLLSYEKVRDMILDKENINANVIEDSIYEIENGIIERRQ